MLNDIWKSILQDIVTIIKEYQKNIDSDKEFILCSEKRILLNYNKLLVKNGEIIQFYKFLRNDFGDDTNLYPLLLSIILYITNDETCIFELVNYIIDRNVDLFYNVFIRHQIEHTIFTNNNLKQNYEIRRKLHKFQISKMESLIDNNYPYIPYENRVENRIIVITNQLLSDYHAPTRNIKEICSAMADIGKEVILIVAIENSDSIYTRNFPWYNPVVVNHFDEFNENFFVKCNSHNIKGYQLLIQSDNLDKMRNLLHDIYLLKPQFVWYMGGTSLFADLLNKFTTVLSMPFTDGYSISEAPIMIEYMKSKSDEINKMEDYLFRNKQVPIHFNFEQTIKPSSMKYCRSEFNLPDNDFLITIVGNRLNEEITESFIEALRKIMDIDSSIHIVFIGNMNQIEAFDNNRVSYLGMQSDLIGVLSLMDLFINPPRKGGGTSAYWSLYNSIPVITLDYCDVANCVTNDFICKDVKEMVDVVNKHFNNKEYHQEMRIKAKSIINQIEMNNNIQDNINTLLNYVKELLIN